MARRTQPRAGASATVSVFLTTDDGVPGPAVEHATGVDPRSVTVGDVNGDGFPDLAVVNETSNSISLLLGDGTGAFASHVQVPAGTLCSTQDVDTTDAQSAATDWLTRAAL